LLSSHVIAPTPSARRRPRTSTTATKRYDCWRKQGPAISRSGRGDCWVCETPPWFPHRRGRIASRSRHLLSVNTSCRRCAPIVRAARIACHGGKGPWPRRARRDREQRRGAPAPPTT
jgi:hypothetical protein